MSAASGDASAGGAGGAGSELPYPAAALAPLDPPSLMAPPDLSAPPVTAAPSLLKFRRSGGLSCRRSC